MDQADLIVKALGYTENNGKPKLDKLRPGSTGEIKSIFQFLPETWAGYSTETFGKVVPVTNDNEVAVTKKKVKQWIEEDTKNGIPADQIPRRIASRWNSGDPEAYKGTFSTGKRRGAKAIGPSSKNPKVIFNVPKYVQNFDRHFNQISKENGQVQQGNQVSKQVLAESTNPPTMAKTTQPVDQSSPAKEMMMNLLSSTAVVPPDTKAFETKTSKGGLLQGLLLGKDSL